VQEKMGISLLGTVQAALILINACQLIQCILDMLHISLLPVHLFDLDDHRQQVAQVSLLLAASAQVFKGLHSYGLIVVNILEHYLIVYFSLLNISFDNVLPRSR